MPRNPNYTPNKKRIAGRKQLGIDCNGDPIYLTPQERSRPGKKGLQAWCAPEDMPDNIVVQVLAGKMCGARTRSKNAHTKYCKNSQVIRPKDPNKPPPWRCKYHGGGSTGPATDAKPNFSHGLYSNAILPGEEEIYERICEGKLDDEIKITKLRLIRALTAEARVEQKIAEEEDIESEMVCETIENSEGWNSEGPIGGTKKTKKLPNYHRIINDIISSLIKLENQRYVMEGGQGNALTPEERAARARAFLREAKRTVGSIE